MIGNNNISTHTAVYTAKNDILASQDTVSRIIFPIMRLLYDEYKTIKPISRYSSFQAF